MTDYGSFRLGDVSGLPNVHIAFPGEHWSDGVAKEAITPGELVVQGASGAKKGWLRHASGAVDPRAAIATRVIEPPDRNPGSEYNEQLGPNQIRNRTIALGAYVHAYHSGVFHITLRKAEAVVPGDLLMFDPLETPQTGKTTTGAWKKTAVAANAFLVVEEFRPNPGSTTEGIVTARSLRTQM